MSSPLDQSSFDQLLSALGTGNRDEGALAYENLRLRLIRFFSWEGCLLPEDCADEVFNRVASKLAAGEKIASLPAFASGVARLVLKETIRGQSREQHRQVLHFPAPKPASPETPEEQCFDRCFGRLPGEARQLLLDYYRGDASGRIEQRQKMAAARNISLNSLRNRALRLREKLEAAMRDCLGSRDVSGPSNTKGENA